MISSLSDPLRRQVQAADVPLDRLASSTQLDDKSKVAEASRQFEAIFVRQILSEAQSSGHGKGVASGIYQDMITTQTAENISRSGGLGLARCFQNQLSHGLKTPHALSIQTVDSGSAPAANAGGTTGRQPIK
jgi:Rod binding domain-containing protein